jgi:outer membrane receptor for ferrienterochelin and colicins
VPTASFATLFNEQKWRQQSTDRHTLVDAEYGRSIRGTRVTLRASFDRFTNDGTYPFAGESEGAPTLVALNSAVGTRWSVGSRLTRSFGGRHTVTAGVEFIDNVRQDQSARYVDPPLLVLDNHRSSRQHGVYVQDEVRLARWLIVNAGLRYDGYEEFLRATPRAALIVLPSSAQSLKYLYGRAFRTPNAFEMNTVFFGEEVENLRPESIDTHELVWERYINDWLRTSASTYWYKGEQLITLIPDDSSFLGISYVNRGEVRAKGLEFEAQMRFGGASRALMSYALQSAVDQETQARLPNSPRHMVKSRISLPGPTRQSFVSVEGQYLSSRETLAGLRVSAATTFNVTMVQPLGRAWELTGGVRNIFDNQYLDPVSTQHRQDAIPQNGRTARIGLRWSLWAK